MTLNNTPAQRSGKRNRRCQALFIWAILTVSLLPLALEIGTRGEKLSALPLANTVDVPVIDPIVTTAVNWLRASDGSVQELRPLAAFPDSWQGPWTALDKNYSRFERWFSDNLGLRSLMIRGKNELDYLLFRSSTRVYFGKNNDVYGRRLIDLELPATERLFAVPGNVDSVTKGAVSLNRQLQAEGITAVWIVPMMKEYFEPNTLPFFAPHLEMPTHFQRFYNNLKNQPDLHFVDSFEILSAARGKYPLFYHQDFHWTDMAAMAVADKTVETIARLAGSKTRWHYPMDYSYEPFIGSESRFSARMGDEGSIEPMLKKTWTDRHVINTLDAKKTGFEFETDTLHDADLLPEICVYGNSFSDGIMRAGFADYFQKVVKLDRNLLPKEIPALARNRCKYVVIQMLDLSTPLWASLRQ